MAFSRDGEETLKKYSTYITEEVAPYIEIRTVKYTQSELSQAQTDMVNTLKALEIRLSSAGVNIVENCTEVNILEADRAKAETAIQNGSLKVPDCMRIKYSKGIISMSLNLSNYYIG